MLVSGFRLLAKIGRVNLQSWQLTCPQTVRKKARSLKYNDIQTQSLTSNPILTF
jgi:hypothetical protein